MHPEFLSSRDNVKRRKRNHCSVKWTTSWGQSTYKECRVSGLCGLSKGKRPKHWSISPGHGVGGFSALYAHKLVASPCLMGLANGVADKSNLHTVESN